MIGTSRRTVGCSHGDRIASPMQCILSAICSRYTDQNSKLTMIMSRGVAREFL